MMNVARIGKTSSVNDIGREVSGSVDLDIEKHYVSQVYTEIAPYFDSTRGYLWSWIKDFISTIPDKSRVLDLGCGNGRNLEACLVENRGLSVIGLDQCEKLVEICREKKCQAVVGDICQLPFQDASVDVIMMIASFHHLASRERRIQCLEECYRVLTEKGKMVISVWSINQPAKTRRVFKHYGDHIVPWTQPGRKKREGVVEKKEKTYHRYYYLFEISELEQLCQECGFKIYHKLWDCGNEILYLAKIPK